MTNHSIARGHCGRARGFTLIELMISMILGLLIVGSVVSVMLANKASYRTNEGLAQVQESARTAYELLAHDVRQADGTGCGRGSGVGARVASVLTGTAWWQSPLPWFGMRGYDSSQVDTAVSIGTATGERVAGTDSIQVESMDGTGLPLDVHDTVNARLDIHAATSGFGPGDVMLVCDFDHTTIFKAITVAIPAPGTVSLFHNSGGSTGNCSQGLGFPTDCATTTGNVYPLLHRNAQIGRLVVTDWYIGNNGRATEGGRSLYRIRLVGGVVGAPEEIVAGVNDMQMQFRASGSNSIIANASLVTDWSAISSVLIQLTAQSSDTAVSTSTTVNSGRVQRTFNYLVSLRNRLP